MLGDAEDARDVAQLTFVRVWENLDRYDPAWAFSTWLFRIAGNLAIDALRARGTRQRTEAESFRLVKGRADERRARRPRAPRRDEVRRVFERCATVLSEKQRLVFVLREFEEKESREIAEILELPRIHGAQPPLPGAAPPARRDPEAVSRSSWRDRR